MSKFIIKDAYTRRIVKAMEAAASAGLSTMIVGAPGTGKTASVRALAETKDYDLITIVGSRMEPTDVMGMPKGGEVSVEIDGRETIVPVSVFLMPDWQERVLREKRVILFLDEFSNTSRAVQASFLTIIQDREFPNGLKIPKETIIIGAMNPPEQAADGHEMSLPTTNRLLWLTWHQSAAGWCEGMLTNWDRDCSPEELRWKAYIAGFVKDNPTWLHAEPKDVDDVGLVGVNVKDPSEMTVYESAWASGRSWDNLSKALANTEENDTALQDLLAQGLVGHQAAMNFRDWFRQQQTIRPEDLIKDPQKLDWSKVTDVGSANSALRGIITLMDEENFAAVVAVFDKVAEDGQDHLGAPFITELATKGVSGKYGNITANKNLMFPVMRKYKEVSKRTLGRPKS